MTETKETFVSERSNRIDFLFWTGYKMIAVEISGDGPSHISSTHVEKDRKFMHANIMIIHITNDEIDTYGIDVVRKLLPKEIISW